MNNLNLLAKKDIEEAFRITTQTESYGDMSASQPNHTTLRVELKKTESEVRSLVFRFRNVGSTKGGMYIQVIECVNYELIKQKTATNLEIKGKEGLMAEDIFYAFSGGNSEQDDEQFIDLQIAPIPNDLDCLNNYV